MSFAEFSVAHDAVCKLVHEYSSSSSSCSLPFVTMTSTKHRNMAYEHFRSRGGGKKPKKQLHSHTKQTRKWKNCCIDLLTKLKSIQKYEPHAELSHVVRLAGLEYITKHRKPLRKNWQTIVTSYIDWAIQVLPQMTELFDFSSSLSSLPRSVRIETFLGKKQTNPQEQQEKQEAHFIVKEEEKE